MTPARFTYKPHPLASAVTVEIASGHVSLSRRRRNTRRIDFDRIRRIRYWEIDNRGIVSRGFMLKGRNQPGIRIEFADNGLRTDDSHAAAFQDMTRTLLEALERQRPGLEVAIATGLPVRIAICAIGLLLGLFSFALALVFLFDAPSPSSVVPGIGLLVTSALAGLMAWSSRPWRRIETLSPARLARHLGGFA